jgi:hypothetical protein
MSANDGLGFLIGFSVLVGLIWGILKGRKQSKRGNERAKTDDNEEQELSREDSEFDGAILFDEPLFPPEFDDLEDP